MTGNTRKGEMHLAAKAERMKLSTEDIALKSRIIQNKVLSEIKDCRCVMVYISK